MTSAEKLADNTQIEFEGQPLLTLDYQQNQKDILRGLAVIDTQRGKNKGFLPTVIVTVIAFGMAFIYPGSDPWVWIKGGIILLLLLALQVIWPPFARRLTVKKYPKEKLEGRIQFFTAGLQIAQGEQVANIPFRYITVYEDDERFIMVIGAKSMMVLRKDTFDKMLPLAKKILTANLGQRFIEVDSKGKPKATV